MAVAIFSHFSETLFTLDFNSCSSFTSVSYWSLINCTDFFLSGDESASFELAISSSSPPCLFSLPSSFSVSFFIFAFNLLISFLLRIGFPVFIVPSLRLLFYSRENRSKIQ